MIPVSASGAEVLVLRYWVLTLVGKSIARRGVEEMLYI